MNRLPCILPARQGPTQSVSRLRILRLIRLNRAAHRQPLPLDPAESEPSPSSTAESHPALSPQKPLASAGNSPVRLLYGTALS